jgi:hypothetical protein
MPIASLMIKNLERIGAEIRKFRIPMEYVAVGQPGV